MPKLKLPKLPLSLKIMWLAIALGAGFLTFHYTQPRAIEFDNTKILGQTDPLENGKTIPQTKTKQSTTYQEQITTANQAFENHNYQKAISEYSKALKFQPDSLETKVQIGRSYLNAREIDKAREIFFQLNPEDPQVAKYQAITLTLYQEYQAAEQLFQQAQIPNSKHHLFTDAFETFNYYEDSDQTFLQALLANAFIQNQEYQASIPLLFDILDKKSNYRDAWILLGYSQLQSADFQSAIDAFTNAKDLDPDKAQTLFFLGLSYLKDGQSQQAMHYIEESKNKGYNPISS